MHIAYVTETYPPELNGVALTVERTVEYLRGRGHRVDLIRPRKSGEPEAGVPSDWLTRGWPIPMYPEVGFGYASAAAFRRRFAERRPDLAHLATPGPLCWNALHAARQMGIVATSDFRTNFHRYSHHYRLGAFAPLVLWALRRFHNRTAKTFVPTHAVESELEAAGFRHLAVVGRGVDAVRFDPGRRSDSQRATWGAVGDAPVLLSVGRIAGEKNIGLALQAFDALRQRRADACMVVVGDGPLRRRLEAAHPAVRFVGTERGDALATAYASADLFVFPSLSETFGNVTLEALAAGLPVVAFDSAAAGEHVVHGVSGLLVPPADADGFVHAVVGLAMQTERLAAMRMPAAEAGRRARWDEVLGRFERHLQNTIDVDETSSAPAAIVA